MNDTDIVVQGSAILRLADLLSEPIPVEEFETSEKIRVLKAAIDAYDKSIVFNRYEQMACALSAALRAIARNGA